MAQEQPESLVGAARDQYLKRLQTRMEFLHDFVSGYEDGWGLDGQELESIVEHLSRVGAVVAAAEIRLVVDRRQHLPHAYEPGPQGDNVIPFRPRLAT
jgi:hypothetical protein